MPTAYIGKPAQNEWEAHTNYYRGVQMNYHNIDDWRAQTRDNNAPRVTADNLLASETTTIYPTALAAWTAPRHKYTAAHDSFREYAQSCFPPYIMAAKHWNAAGQ